MTDVDLHEKDWTEEERKLIQKMQVIYVKNFIIYSKPRTNYGKQVIKRSRQFADMCDTIVKGHESGMLFDSELMREEIVEFEDYLAKFSGGDSFLKAKYEQLQIYLHIHLKQIDAGYCLEHNINLHYCHKCQVKHGVKKENDKDF